VFDVNTHHPQPPDPSRPLDLYSDEDHEKTFKYRGADKSLARPTSLSIEFSVQGTGGSPTGPDPENTVDDQDNGSAGAR
jgi:hypothetical protein